MEKNKNQYLSIFSSDSYFASVFKKAEKITSALYLVTNLFPTHEPLRDTLRAGALEVIAGLSRARTAALSEETDAARAILSTISEVMTLCAIARTASLMSEMNAAIIGREYAKLLQLLETEMPRSADEKSFVFSSDFFKLPDENNLAPAETLRDEIVGKLFESDIKDISSPNHLYKGQPKGISRGQGPLKATVNGRRESILKLAAEKGKISIKDASVVIRSCSEKTLQREVLSLVAEGVLKKEGERRWSRYSLA